MHSAPRSQRGWKRAWCDLADRFRTRTQERVDGIRGDAADLFAIDLPTLAVPTVSGEQERFFYLFLHVGSSTEGLGRLASRILPAGLVRRRMLANARRQLIREFDKHAGRARWDLAQRLNSARRTFEATMHTELDHTIESVLVAAGRAEELRAATVKERAQHVALDAATLRTVERTLAAVR